MIAYILLISIPFVFSFIGKSNSKIILGNNETIKKSNFVIPVFFISLFLLLAFRAKSIGRDLPNYEWMFNTYRSSSFTSLLIRNDNVEYAYKILNWLVGRFTNSFQVFMAIAAAITLLPMYLVYREDRRDSYLKVVLFLNMTTFIMLFSGIRQGIAMAICMFAYLFIKQKKIVAFIICVFIAASFHISALAFLPAYKFYYMQLKRRHLPIIFISVLLVLIFNRLILSAIIVFVSQFVPKYSSSTTSTGAFMSIVLFAIFTLFSYLISNESCIDTETIGLRNFLVIALIIQLFAPIHFLIMRVGYYYILFIPILLPKLINSPERGNIKLAQLAKIILLLFFIFYFLFTTYRSYKTGVSSLDTVPYIPFWK